jgi:hypothetical protein
MNSIQTLRVLWGALLTSVGLFAVVMLMLPASTAEPQHVHLLTFAGLAASCALVSLLLPGRLHAAAVQQAAPAVEEVPDPDAPSGFGGAKRVRVFKDPRAARALGLRSYQQYMILGCALSESVALFGFVLNRLGHPQTTALPFILAGLALMALRFPTEQKALALLQSAAGARLT